MFPVMSPELEDEITSINSIYGETTLVPISEEPFICAFTLPALPSTVLRVEFYSDYPESPPCILGTQTVGNEANKGDGKYIVDSLREILGDIYTPGAPCVYDLIEEANAKIQQLRPDESTESTREQEIEADGQQHSSTAQEAILSDPVQPSDDLGEPPPWALSEVITEKKSVFVARSAPVTSVDEAKTYLAHLLGTDKKAAKATHNITAWRIQGQNGVQYQDCDDDGETAAGGRLLHLLELMGIWGAMVVVTRWYGGVQLGPDRFRIINSTARDALVKGGFTDDGAKDGKAEAGKKKGKK